MNKRIFSMVIELAFLLAIVSAAHSFPSYTDQFNSTYGTLGTTGGTTLGSCITCHNQPTGGGRNGYGTDFSANNHDFTAIEGLDSDGDSFINIDEIDAGTFPGDSNDFPLSDPTDTIPPAIQSFSVSAAYAALTVPINSFTATDDTGVTGYMITESATPPNASAPGWTSVAPVSYTFSTPGMKTLYGWAKDVAGNVSDGALAEVDITTSTAANAGPDQTVTVGSLVTLDGSSSSNSPNTVASYSWTQETGPQVALSDPAAVRPTFTAPSVAGGGASLVFILKVTDVLDIVTTDSCIVTVTQGNLPPVVDAGLDQTVSEGALVTLDGSSSSDPNDGIASYLWEQTGGAPVTLSLADTALATFTAPNVGVGGASLTFQLTVTDQGGLVSRDTCIVNVTFVNEPPQAVAGLDLAVEEGKTVTLDGSLSQDPDDGIVSYLWEQIGGTPAALSDARAVQPTFVAPIVDAAGTVLTFRLTVEDAGTLRSSDELLVTVNDNGISGYPVEAITTYTVSGEPLGFVENNGGVFTKLDMLDATAVGDPGVSPGNFPLGLVDMALKVDPPGSSASITILLPSPAPDGAKWYKYSAKNGWKDCSAYATFSPARDSVTLDLSDGGNGDDDGVANGSIVDPSGLALSAPASSSGAAPAVAGGDSGGCFIASAYAGSHQGPFPWGEILENLGRGFRGILKVFSLGR